MKEETLKTEARRIHKRVLTVDTHCDTPLRIVQTGLDIGERHEPGRMRMQKVDLPRMVEGGLDAVFFSVFVVQGDRTPDGYAWARKDAEGLLGAIEKVVADYPQQAGLATSPQDAYRLEGQGKRAIFIGMENGYPIGKDLSLLKKYYDRGVRYLTLCHSADNDICDSSQDRRQPEDNGLSDFGKHVVAECNRLGIMVDVSHASDRSFFDVLEVTRAPIIASHSCVRALRDIPRNASDPMLRALASNGGVIQVSMVSENIKEIPTNPLAIKARDELEAKYGSYPFKNVQDENLRRKLSDELIGIYERFPTPKATVRDFVDHIDHVVKLIGVNHVGIGTDFDGGGELEDCEDVSEFPRVTEELLRRGYSEEDIRKIWGANIMRVFRKVIKLSGEQ
jgi:membrane dipeptidase